MGPWQKSKRILKILKSFGNPKLSKFQNRRKHQIQLETFVDNFKMLKCERLKEGNKKLRE